MFAFLVPPSRLLTPLGLGVLEGKKSLSQHWEQQRLSKDSEPPGGADTVTMELTVLLNLPHFPEEWQLIMDDPLLNVEVQADRAGLMVFINSCTLKAKKIHVPALKSQKEKCFKNKSNAAGSFSPSHCSWDS